MISASIAYSSWIRCSTSSASRTTFAAAGIVPGESVAVDGSFILADASPSRRIAGDEQLEAWANPEAATRPVPPNNAAERQGDRETVARVLMCRSPYYSYLLSPPLRLVAGPTDEAQAVGRDAVRLGDVAGQAVAQAVDPFPHQLRLPARASELEHAAPLCLGNQDVAVR